MFESWFIILFLIFVILLSLLVTVVFCFWSVYLLDAIQRKWKVNRNSLRCIQKGENDSVQQIIAYNSKTEFVKFVFLFFMNLVEWLGFLFGSISLIENFIQQYKQYRLPNKSILNSVHFNCSREDSNIFSNLYLLHHYSNMDNFFFLLGLVLPASLCMYLSKRFAQKSWIKADKIPILIVIFFLCGIAIQILESFCTTYLIALWCEIFLLVIAFILVVKEYKKLGMIINWSIVDLKNSKNYTLLERQIKMKQHFIKTFTMIWMGGFLMLMSDLINSIEITLTIALDTSTFDDSDSLFSHPKKVLIFTVLNWISIIIGTIGASFILIPYIGFGLSTMCVILWRLIRGKTGYKTHFHNDLDAPLIRE